MSRADRLIADSIARKQSRDNDKVVHGYTEVRFALLDQFGRVVAKADTLDELKAQRRLLEGASSVRTIFVEH